MEFSPIVLDSISPDNFPAVELYVKQDKGFTLYKPQDSDLSARNVEGMRDNGTEYLYINAANSDTVQENLERNLKGIFSSRTLPQSSKNLIFCHTIINGVTHVFKNPGNADAFLKCRSVLDQKFSLKFENISELLNLLSKLEQQYERYLIVHTTQVAILSMYLYEKLFDAKQDELVEIGLGAMLHDIGMLNISSSIIEKNDGLTESEYHKVKTHPRHGHDVLYHMGIKEQVPLDIALDHHERYDGSGYPRGLSEHRIPRHAMVVAICDIYCALTMNRPYKGASTPQQALKTMKIEKKLFDPAIFEGFLEIMNDTYHQEDQVETEQKSITTMSLAGNSGKILELRRELKNAQDDRQKLLKLHSVVIDCINEAYGEEKEAFVAFRTELTNLLNSMSAAVKQN